MKANDRGDAIMTDLTSFIAPLRKMLREHTRATLNASALLTAPARPRRPSPHGTVSRTLPGYRPERGPARFLRRPFV
jgi:hypothetical protein